MITDSNSPAYKTSTLCRAQRAAVAVVGMVVITAVSIMLIHYGHLALAYGNELFSFMAYTIWVMLGKPKEN